MGGPVCVVVADDDVLLREGLASLLEGSGFDVVGRVRRRAQLLELIRDKTGAGRDGVCAGGERGLNRALSARRLHRGVRWRTRRRLPCNRHDRLRTCWCVKAFRCNIARPAHFHAEGGRLRRRGRCGLGWGVSRTAWRRRNSRNARWYGYPMCTST